MFAEKTCFNVLCTFKATSLSKMAKLVWRYSDDARAIIENVYKTARRKIIIEPRHEISNNVVCATSKRLRPACAYAQSDKAVLLLWIFYVFVLSCVCYVLCASVYMCFLVTCWERADLLALVCGVFCEFVTFPLVSWVRCGT